MTAADVNGSPIAAGTADPEGRDPLKGVPEGRGFAPPPPPPTAVDGRLVEYQRLVDDMGALLAEQAAELGRRPKARREPSPWLAKAKQLPARYAAVGAIGLVVVGTAVGVNRFTPQRYDAGQIAAIAADQAAVSAGASLRSEIAAARADATQVLVPDPFAAYGRELTEDSKTAIGYDASTGNKSLNPARQQVVADQVREALSQRSMTLDEMRLSSLGPSQLRVHNNPAEGYQLFAPPAVRAPDSMTTTTVPTATSAP